MASSPFESKTAAKILGDDGANSRTLPIACRFVPMDQWLFTHIDTSWKIKEIKHWILTKCDAWEDSRSGRQHPQPPRFRPASPVTFAPSRKSSFESVSSGFEAGDDDDIDDEDDENDIFAYNNALCASETQLSAASVSVQEGVPISRTATRQELSTAYSSMSLSSAFKQVADPTSSAAQKYVLFSFSCGHILEDEASLNWYKLRPFELLELHRVSAIVTLPRRSALAYAEPYFESPVRFCEISSHGRHARKGAGGVANATGVRGIAEDQHSAHSLEWKNRWAIIREGILNICKDAATPPTHRFPLASIVAIRGPEQADLSSRSQPRVISVKFRLPNKNSDNPEWSPNYDEINYSDPLQPLGKAKRKHSKSSIWVIIDMPTSHCHENILRVLHRLAPVQVQSIFLPSVTQPTKTPHPSPISRLASPSSPSPLGSPPSPSSRFGGSSPTLNNNHGFGPNFVTCVRYPEWRHDLFDRARQAGLGTVGPAMAHYLCGCENDPAGLHSDLRKQASTMFSSASSTFSHGAHASISSTGSVGTTMSAGVGFDDEADSEDDEDDDMESLMEWEGWARDVARIAEKQRPLAPAPSSRRSYRDPFMNTEFGAFSSTRAVSSPGYIPPRALSPSSPSSSESEWYDTYESVEMHRTTSTRARAMSFVPPHLISESSSSSSLSPRRSRSSTVTSIRTITPDSGRSMAAPVPSNTGRNSALRPLGNEGSFASPNLGVKPTLRLSFASGLNQSNSSDLMSPSSTSSGTRSVSSGGSSSSQATDPTPLTAASSASSGGLGLGNMKRIVRNVSIRNAISAGTDRFARSLEDALDFVDGRYYTG